MLQSFNKFTYDKIIIKLSFLLINISQSPNPLIQSNPSIFSVKNKPIIRYQAFFKKNLNYFKLLKIDTALIQQTSFKLYQQFQSIQMSNKENPETTIITPRTMYEYDHHTNIPWNDTQYNPVREYLDPIQQMNQRKYAQQEKGQKDNRYKTKKGFYMDYHIKVVKALPAPCAHNLPDGFDQTQNKKQSNKHKMDKSLSKYTYLDWIQTEQKNRKTPAPGSYNLNKTDKEIKEEIAAMKNRKRSVGAKRYFYEDTEHLSNVLPGPGSRNPHLDVPNLHLNKTTHRFWIDKHKKQGEHFLKQRKSMPGPPSYTPCALQYSTFDRIATSQQKRKKKQTKTGFGTDTKFAYDRPSKKKIIETRPAPCSYNMMIEWKGKNMDVKKNNWIRSRSTGFSESVYN